jgi:hypothetical protein
MFRLIILLRKRRNGVPEIGDFDRKPESLQSAFHQRAQRTAFHRKSAEIRERRDRRSHEIGYAKFRSRSHHALIRVYDEAGNVIETPTTWAISESGERYAH